MDQKKSKNELLKYDKHIKQKLNAQISVLQQDYHQVELGMIWMMKFNN